MLKNLGLAAAGLVAGLIIMSLWRPSPDVPGARLGDDLLADGTPAPSDAAARDAAARLAALEERVARLEAQRPAEAAGPAPAAGSATLTRVPPVPREPAPETLLRNATPTAQLITAEMRAAQVAASETLRLVNAGFAPDRAEWVRRKIDELRMQELQARYEAQRSGQSTSDLGSSFVERRLRAEMGDDDYERYLRAFGRSTSVSVSNVYAGSPAATAGMLPGDTIVSYGGKRVFDQNELNTFILEGTPGESVVVEVDRNGQRLQLVVPRGPMGVTGSGTLSLNVRSTQGILTDGR